MSKVDLIFLHGFLGRPADWDGVLHELKRAQPYFNHDAKFYTPDYLNYPDLGPKNDFDHVGTAFIEWIQRNTDNPRKFLVGYSLGGRIALHILEQDPSLFERVFCLSVNPGFTANQTVEKNERAQKDQAWAKAFCQDEWEDVVRKWNQQSVFVGSANEPERLSTQFRRERLGEALTNWSLAKQRNQRDLIRSQVDKIHWLTGDKDVKFKDITRELVKEIPTLRVAVIPESGHRIIFDKPSELAQIILKQIKAQ